MGRDGGVRAMVGGRDYEPSQFNRATEARRQPGSSWKHFIYPSPALENGLTPENGMIAHHPDRRWSPDNYEDQYYGRVMARRSPTRPTWWPSASPTSRRPTVIDVGVASASSRSARPQPWRWGGEVFTPLEMASAYGAIRQGGAVTA